MCVALWILALCGLAIATERYNPRLMAERANWRKQDTKRFDKILLAVYMPFAMTQPALAALDAVRFRWSSMPFAFAYLGAVLYFLSMTLVGWVLSMNPYAETSVRVQTDRGQTVVTSGPYKVVRHPMYVGAILMYAAQALVLGSLWALALAGLIAILMIVRTALEDRMLRRELPGYAEFASHTRYRLLPGLW
jgi:protein-S-isoprenylcysteine O-methyltransferase Ste14